MGGTGRSNGSEAASHSPAAAVIKRSNGSRASPTGFRIHSRRGWLDHIKSQVSPRTHERYGELASKNIAPLLGRVALTRLRPAQISAAYTDALSAGRRD